MAKIKFDKPTLTITEQIILLQNRGLKFENQEKAAHLLQFISYYRLSGYWFPLLADKKNHIFKQDATFEKAFELYKFDRAFRLLIIGELEKIEIAVRSQMIQQLSLNNSTYWFLDKNFFKNEALHAKILKRIADEIKRSDEEFIIRFKEKYADDFPPSWMTLEISSFGSLSVLFNVLKAKRFKRNIANHFGVDENTFQSWLHSFVYLRNICAHHSRLWNKDIRIKPKMPENPKKVWLSNNEVENNRIFSLMSMILFFLQTINPNNTFVFRFNQLLEMHPNIDLSAMGFPTNWKEEILWSTEITK